MQHLNENNKIQNYLTTEINDTGKGIDLCRHSYLFKPFRELK